MLRDPFADAVADAAVSCVVYGRPME